LQKSADILSPSLYQGCQISLDTMYQNGVKYSKLH
jgi:hypothetical protein